MNDIFEILITSGIIVSAVSGIFSLRVSYNSNKTLKMIESNKISNEISQYRYKTLHKYLEEIKELEAVEYNISTEADTAETVKKASEHYYAVEKICTY